MAAVKKESQQLPLRLLFHSEKGLWEVAGTPKWPAQRRWLGQLDRLESEGGSERLHGLLFEGRSAGRLGADQQAVIEGT